MIKAIRNELGERGLGRHPERGLVCVLFNCYVEDNSELQKRALKALVAKRLIRHLRGMMIFSLSLSSDLRKLYC